MPPLGQPWPPWAKTGHTRTGPFLRDLASFAHLANLGHAQPPSDTLTEYTTEYSPTATTPARDHTDTSDRSARKLHLDYLHSSAAQLILNWSFVSGPPKLTQRSGFFLHLAPRNWRATVKPFVFLSAFLILMGSTACSLRASIVFDPDPNTGHWLTVPNGGFETGDMTGWSPQIPPNNNGYGVFVASSDVVLSGSYSAKTDPLLNFTGPGFANISDYIPVQANETYVLSGFFNAEGLTSGNLSLDLSDIGFNIRINAVIGSPGWHFVWGEFTPTIDYLVRVRLVRDTDVKLGEYGYIDEVGITPASEFVAPSTVPEPTSFVIFAALGLVGAVLVRKQKRKVG